MAIVRCFMSLSKLKCASWLLCYATEVEFLQQNICFLFQVWINTSDIILVGLRDYQVKIQCHLWMKTILQTALFNLELQQISWGSYHLTFLEFLYSFAKSWLLGSFYYRKIVMSRWQILVQLVLNCTWNFVSEGAYRYHTWSFFPAVGVGSLDPVI